MKPISRGAITVNRATAIFGKDAPPTGTARYNRRNRTCGGPGMTDDKYVRNAAERVIALEAELESAGDATTGDDMAMSRDILSRWVATVVGVVSSPGVGRVTLIHANGTQSKIASPDLPYLLAKPVSFPKRDGGAD